MRYLPLIMLAFLPVLCIAQGGKKRALKVDPEKTEREGLLLKAEAAVAAGYLDSAVTAYSRALWMKTDAVTCQSLAKVHLLRSDTAQFCKYSASFSMEDDGEKEFYHAHCLREDSVPFAETGSDPNSYPLAVVAKRTWSRASNQTVYKLFDAEGKMLLSMYATPVDTVFLVMDEMPQFLEGEAAMFTFLGKNVRYPEGAIDRNIQGVVYLNFIVETDGTLEQVTLLRGLHHSIDEESVRVVRAMPPWKPGLFRGTPVRASFNLPIRYTLH